MQTPLYLECGETISWVCDKPIIERNICIVESFVRENDKQNKNRDIQFYLIYLHLCKKGFLKG